MKEAHQSGMRLRSTQLSFSTTLGTAVDGLQYRLRNGRGDEWSGTTRADGSGVRIGDQPSAGSTRNDDFWPLEESSMILLEVRRDDGTWKHIGSFNYEAGKRKDINVVTGTVALPFRISPVHSGESAGS